MNKAMNIINNKQKQTVFSMNVQKLVLTLASVLILMYNTEDD